MINGESQITTTVNLPSVEAVCRQAAESLPLYGHVVMQVIVDGSGHVHLIECNARFGGASTLSVAAGLDSFYWFLLESTGVDIAHHPFTYDPTRPLRQIRHAADVVQQA